MPLEKEKYEKQIKSTVVRRMVKLIRSSDIFGFEDIINCFQTRVFTARVIGQRPARLLYIPRQKFLEQNG